MKAIGKKSLQPLINTVLGIIIALAVPISIISTTNDVGLNYYIWMSVYCAVVAAIIVYHAYFLIVLPKDIIFLNGDTGEVTVYVTRRKKRSFNVNEIANIRRTRPTVTFWRMVANLTFVLSDGRKIRARFITDPDSVTFALSRTK